jgi:hypothetical protein
MASARLPAPRHGGASSTLLLLGALGSPARIPHCIMHMPGGQLFKEHSFSYCVRVTLEPADSQPGPWLAGCLWLALAAALGKLYQPASLSHFQSFLLLPVCCFPSHASAHLLSLHLYYLHLSAFWSSKNMHRSHALDIFSSNYRTSRA